MATGMARDPVSPQKADLIDGSRQHTAFRYGARFPVILSTMLEGRCQRAGGLARGLLRSEPPVQLGGRDAPPPTLPSRPKRVTIYGMKIASRRQRNLSPRSARGTTLTRMASTNIGKSPGVGRRRE
jgi:hypothetical protein